MKKKLIICFYGILFSCLIWQVAYSFKRVDIERLIRDRACQNCDLYKANLDALDLTGADLRGANLKRAKLRRATLIEADLTGANIIGTNFEGAMWIDGTICQKGSIGICVRTEK